MQKRRARYKAVFKKYPSNYNDGAKHFDTMVKELCSLNLKYLQQLLDDARDSGAFAPWYGDYHRMIVNAVTTAVMERTILK